MLTTLKRISALLLLISLTACSTIRDPRIQSETNRKIPLSAPPTKILFVIDYSLEKKFFTSPSSRPSAWKDDRWDHIEASLNQWSKASGVELTPLLYTDHLKRPELDTKGYSHLIFKQLTRGTGSMSVQYGASFYGRSWRVTAVDLDATGKPNPNSQYSITYDSDGIVCFGSTFVNEKDACVDTYLKTLSSHLKVFGPQLPNLVRVTSK